VCVRACTRERASATRTLFEPISRTPPFHFAVPRIFFPSCRPLPTPSGPHGPPHAERLTPQNHCRIASRGRPRRREKPTPLAPPAPPSQCEIRQPLLKLATTLLKRRRRRRFPTSTNNTRISRPPREFPPHGIGTSDTRMKQPRMHPS